MKKGKKIVTSLAIAAILCLIFAASVSAASASATLTINDTSVKTAKVSGTATRMVGYNSSTSYYDVFMTSRYSTGGFWYVAGDYILDIGVSMSTGWSYAPDLALWDAELNPYGIGTKNCSANVTIYTN